MLGRDGRLTVSVYNATAQRQPRRKEGSQTFNGHVLCQIDLLATECSCWAIDPQAPSARAHIHELCIDSVRESRKVGVVRTGEDAAVWQSAAVKSIEMATIMREQRTAQRMGSIKQRFVRRAILAVLLRGDYIVP